MDWQPWFNFITEEDRDHLEDLDQLRHNDPILWCLVTGSRSSRGIAKQLCWPLEPVKYLLREYKAQGLVMDEQGKNSVIWVLLSTNLLDLAAFSRGVKNHLQVEFDREQRSWSDR